jgi:hypothetical protein
MRPVELTADVERTAGALAGRHRLRGADASISPALALDVPNDLTVAVWHKLLHTGIAAVGLAVAPAALD